MNFMIERVRCCVGITGKMDVKSTDVAQKGALAMLMYFNHFR